MDDFADLHFALAHPLRRQILREMLGRGASLSAVEAASQQEMPLSNVAYHFRVLEERGAIAESGHRSVRGALQRFYGVTPAVTGTPWVLESLGLGGGGNWMDTVEATLEQVVGTGPEGDAIIDEVEAAIRTDGETVVLDLPRGGEWATTHKALVAALPDPWFTTGTLSLSDRLGEVILTAWRRTGLADQVPAVCDVLDRIEQRNWERLRRLLHPDVHWTTAVEEHLHGPDAVIACLAGDPPPAPPAYHELRDGRIIRWIDTPG